MFREAASKVILPVIEKKLIDLLVPLVEEYWKMRTGDKFLVDRAALSACILQSTINCIEAEKMKDYELIESPNFDDEEEPEPFEIVDKGYTVEDID